MPRVRLRWGLILGCVIGIGACGGAATDDVDSSGASGNDGSSGASGPHAPNRDSGSDDSGTAGPGDEAFPFIPCPDDLPPFAIGMDTLGTNGVIRARLVDASPAPPEKFFNDWTVEFHGADGSVLGDVELTMARAWMPAHGHDGTYAPIITPREEPGQFAVDQLNLWMRGHWEVQIEATSPGVGDDSLVFDACVED